MSRSVSVTLGDTVDIRIGKEETLSLNLEEARTLTWNLLGFYSLRNESINVLIDAASAGIAEKLHALAREFEP